MTLTIHIDTQYAENYGDEVNPHWKFKGGDTFVVTGFDAPMNDQIGKAAAAVVESLRGQIEYADDYSSVTIIDWQFASVDDLTMWERDQQEFEGRITSASPRIDVTMARLAA